MRNWPYTIIIGFTALCLLQIVAVAPACGGN